MTTKKKAPEPVLIAASVDLGKHTLIARAKAQVSGFAELIERFEKKLSISGRSKSTFLNYSRHLASMALHFDCLPTELEEDQVTDYLHFLQSTHQTPSESYFKHTVYGLRALYKYVGKGSYVKTKEKKLKSNQTRSHNPEKG